ncbi:MAG TPA: CopG family antitoxin [Bryobacteraceae bacterium]|nr:CopG family antitoxin [Bryobacteraceae bacterium]
MKKAERLSQKPIPSFASEREEAAWWDAHPEALTERFRAAARRGRVRRLSQTSLPGASETVTIRIPDVELKRARELAARRGLRYQTYIKMLLHEALDAEEKRLAG